MGHFGAVTHAKARQDLEAAVATEHLEGDVGAVDERNVYRSPGRMKRRRPLNQSRQPLVHPASAVQILRELSRRSPNLVPPDEGIPLHPGPDRPSGLKILIPIAYFQAK